MSGTSSDNEWQRVVQRVVQQITKSGTTSEKKWQRVIKIDNEWQWGTVSESSGTANENDTVHFKEWMIAIISMTKSNTLLLQEINLKGL